jgi:uncharacterized protein involved in exopolysaccharide biosynthesis
MVTLASFYMTPKYKVYAELLLDVEKDTTAVAPSSLNQRFNLLDLTNKINLENALIKSSVVLKSVALKHPDLKKRLYQDESMFRRRIKDFFSSTNKQDYSSKKEVDKRIRFLSKKMDVSQIPNSNILMITLLAGDPVYGARVLNDLLESYLNHRAKVEKFPGATNFFDEQISNVQNRLRELEENLSNFQQKEKIIDYNNEITRVSENLRIYEQALANIKIQLIHLKQNYKEQDPQIKNLISEERALALVIQDLKNQAETLPQKIKIINILKRDIANEASTLANLVQKKNQEMVSENKDRRLENVKLITLPTYSIKKEKPKRGTNMVLGAFLGLFAGLGLALLREYHDQSFNNEEEISQYLGLPVLGKIEEIQKTKRFADLK